MPCWLDLLLSKNPVDKMASCRDRRRAPSPLRREVRRVSGHCPSVPTQTMANCRDTGDQDVFAEEMDTLSCHVTIDSLLSPGTGFNSFSGFLNWAVILLVITHLHMNLENISKYGILWQLGDPTAIISLFLKDPFAWPALYLILCSNIFIFIALSVEEFMTKNWIYEIIGLIIQILNLISLIVFPIGMINLKKSITPVGAILTMLVYIILFFKLLSYKLVNDIYRDRHPKNSKGTLKKTVVDSRQSRRCDRTNAREIAYPANLNMQDLYYFVAAPTLCYQLNYPRSPQFRISFFIRRIIEMVVLIQFMDTLIQQLIVPVIQKSMKPMWEVDSNQFLEYILKLAVPTNFIWIIFFYCFFHSFLNAIAEVLYFADREFYQDWWETKSILKFWTKWNRPAHNWLFRHVYMPLKRQGYEKLYLQGAVFLISSIVCEALLAIPLRMNHFLIFRVMFSQFILAWILEKLMGDTFGNFIMWMNVFFGIPLVSLQYFHDYYVQHRSTNSLWGLY